MEQPTQELPGFKVNGFVVLLIVVAIAIVGSWQLVS